MYLPCHGTVARSDDRLMLSAFFYAAASSCSLESLLPAYRNPRSLRARRQRWERNGTLGKLMEAGAPVIERISASGPHGEDRSDVERCIVPA